MCIFAYSFFNFPTACKFFIKTSKMFASQLMRASLLKHSSFHACINSSFTLRALLPLALPIPIARTHPRLLLPSRVYLPRTQTHPQNCFPSALILRHCKALVAHRPQVAFLGLQLLAHPQYDLQQEVYSRSAAPKLWRTRAPLSCLLLWLACLTAPEVMPARKVQRKYRLQTLRRLAELHLPLTL